MGEMADFYGFYDFDEDFFDSKTQWTDQKGRVIEIKDMDNKHLINTINFLHKKWNHLKKTGSLESGVKKENYDEIGDLFSSYWPLVHELYSRCVVAK